MSNYTITQVKSSIGTRPQVREYLKSLGLKGIGTQVTLAKTPSSEGLIKKVSHLVKCDSAK